MENYEYSSLWRAAFSPCDDGYDEQRKKLEIAYKAFRDNVALLLTKIQNDLPDLTIHDITHVDALWQVASEIAGPGYELNPAEGLVLGGAFLLHDAAQCIAAFPNGIEDLKKTTQWLDSAAQNRYDLTQLVPGSVEFRSVLFDTLRILHPVQARNLPFARWGNVASETRSLFPHDELREAYGHLIGEVAASHWSYPYELEPYAERRLGAPPCLSPANWTVSMLKIALLLRTADAAHLDGRRAPKLLRLINNPKGVSKSHWIFQERLHQVTCDSDRNELRFSGSAFSRSEQDAWWLAFDTAKMVDNELRSADMMLRDHTLQQFSSRSVAHIHSPEAFSQNVPTKDWVPIDASIRVGNVAGVVRNFGGAKLYGNKPFLALREILQNARDAIMACRAMGGLDEHEGSIEVELEELDGTTWLSVQDNGIGMSRFVLTNVLLDFGKSLWNDNSLSSQWPGLAASGFNSVGKFGIGFFSTFMLGDKVKVVTLRQSPAEHEDANQWVLEFEAGPESRPLVRRAEKSELLRRHGTRVSVQLSDPESLLTLGSPGIMFSIRAGVQNPTEKGISLSLAQLTGALAPALEIDVFVKDRSNKREKIISAGDWRRIPPRELIKRLAPTWPPKRVVFGGLDRFQELIDGKGTCVGRGAASAGHFASNFGFSPGVVTTGGIYGGTISDFIGLLAGMQDGLDRKVARPVMDLRTLTDWTAGQAKKLIESQELSLNNSNVLIRLGCKAEHLYIGQHDGEAITIQKFRDLVQHLDEIVLLEQRHLGYDSDDDIPKSDFESGLQLAPNIFVVENIASNSFITELNWPRSVSNELPRGPRKIVSDILEELWSDGNGEAIESDEHIIGYVSGRAIFRPIILVKRNRHVPEVKSE